MSNSLPSNRTLGALSARSPSALCSDRELKRDLVEFLLRAAEDWYQPRRWSCKKVGIVLPASDRRALAAAIERFALDAGVRQRFGDLGRWGIEKRFVPSRTVDKYLSCFELIPETHAAGRSRA